MNARIVITKVTGRTRLTKIRRAKRSERGSILLEFGLAIPILVSLVLGGISTGLAYDTNNSLNNGARESARFAATLPVNNGLAPWLNEIADVAIGSTSGLLDPTVPDQGLCVAYVYPDGTDPDDQTAALIETGGSRSVSNGATCFDDGRPDDERRVQVVLERSSDIEAALFSTTVSLEASSVVRYERTAG